MSVSYDKLWKLLIDKKMNRTELRMLLVLVLMCLQNGKKRIYLDGKLV